MRLRICALLLSVTGWLGAQSSNTFPNLVPVANDGTTGTALHKLAKITATGLVTLTTADTVGAIGIVEQGAGISGSAYLATLGQASCSFDGAVTARDYVQASPTVAGDCHDAGSSLPLSGQIIGIAMGSIGSAGNVDVLLSSFVSAPAGAVTSLGYTPENIAHKNQANGYMGADA